MADKIKVVWITHFSNKDIREKLRFAKPYLVNVLRRFLGYPMPGHSDFAVWNTNAVKHIEKYRDIELTIVMPHYGIAGKSQMFNIGPVKYICYRSQDDYIIPFLKSRLLRRSERVYKKNRTFIRRVIEAERPDIVHIVGAENPYYSIAALDVPDYIPSIVSLQTLLSAPDFSKKYYLSDGVYELRAKIEKEVIRKCTYIAGAKAFRSYVKDSIKEDAIFLDMPLALGLEVDTSVVKKEFDFVYFAANIQKACDDAIEGFGLACKKYPHLTLNVSGGYDESFKKILDNRIQQLGITNNVFFSGSKDTHEGVLEQIKKSRFALLPLKIDLVSSTIREALACGLPVVTTITEGTHMLNKDRMTVLLSEQGDYESMANNMIRLVEDEKLAEQLRNNGIARVRERYSNERYMSMWHQSYISIYNK